MFDFLKYKPHSDTCDFELTFSDKDYEKKIADDVIELSDCVDKNFEIVQHILHTKVNGDIKIRWFNCRLSGEVRRGFLIWVDGLANSSLLNDYILRPLIEGSATLLPPDDGNIEYYTENIIHQGAVAYEKNVRKLVLDINTGNASLFVDGCTNGASFDIKTWEHRGVDSPVNEAVVQGPHEGFNEVLRCNTALIRKSVNSPNLIMETYFLGKQSKTPASLAYIDGTINPELLKEIQKRLSSISAAYVLSVYDVEKMLEERKFMPMPQMLTTERPDKVTRALIEGRAALCVNGSSQALILPSNITDIIASPEDAYLREPYSVFIKLVRIFAVLLSLLTPGIYLATTTFHTDAILTDMLIAINNSASNVPFSPLTEVLIMELSFELIKEAGVRIPGAIGSSLGIVGGLILGQSAVSAGLVSPIVIIIVSVCGIASFAIPSYSLSFAFRISRFAYIFAGAFFGIAGIACALCVHLAMFLGTKSFGVPSCVPFSPSTARNSLISAVFRSHSNITPPSYLKANKEREVNE
ncbi:MAG: spore germination protein [Ruminococcaceae bacterium]|nr:spore germination protein [Oscillospiraceae bacterium]